MIYPKMQMVSLCKLSQSFSTLYTKFYREHFNFTVIYWTFFCSTPSKLLNGWHCSGVFLILTMSVFSSLALVFLFFGFGLVNVSWADMFFNFVIFTASVTNFMVGRSRTRSVLSRALNFYFISCSDFRYNV